MPSPNAKDANVAIAIRPIQLNFMRFLCPCGVPLVCQAATPGTCLGREYRNPLFIVEAVGGLCHFPRARRQLFQKTKTYRCRWTIGQRESHPEKCITQSSQLKTERMPTQLP